MFNSLKFIKLYPLSIYLFGNSVVESRKNTHMDVANVVENEIWSAIYADVKAIDKHFAQTDGVDTIQL